MDWKVLVTMAVSFAAGLICGALTYRFYLYQTSVYGVRPPEDKEIR